MKKQGAKKGRSCSWASEIKDVPTVITETQSEPEDLRQSLSMKIGRKSSVVGWVASVDDCKSVCKEDEIKESTVGHEENK